MEFLNGLPGTALLFAYAFLIMGTMVVGIFAAFVLAFTARYVAVAGSFLLLLEFWHNGMWLYGVICLSAAFFGEMFKQMSLR